MYSLTLFLSLVLAFTSTALITLLLRRYAQRLRLIDKPNERSSHAQPTPRGGGLSIVVVFAAGFSLLFAYGYVDDYFFIAITGAGLLIALISLHDDIKPLPAWRRLLVHLIAAAWVLYWFDKLPALDFGFTRRHWGWPGILIILLAQVWVINLYNFMDGIDGIAASEAVFISAAAVFLLGPENNFSFSYLLLLSCCSGFLLFNWPPASIFLGDIGSCFLGFYFAAGALFASTGHTVPIWCWPILLGVFITDATLTLLQRIARGANWRRAHRSHAYQHAATRWGHGRTTMSITLINILWLLPCAYTAKLLPQAAFYIMFFALAPLFAVAWYLNAGNDER